jgi:hypothetical protein
MVPTRRSLVGFLLFAIAAWGVLSTTAITIFILSNDQDPDLRAIIKMGVGLIVIWCVLGGLVMWAIRDRFVRWARRKSCSLVALAAGSFLATCVHYPLGGVAHLEGGSRNVDFRDEEGNSTG